MCCPKRKRFSISPVVRTCLDERERCAQGNSGSSSKHRDSKMEYMTCLHTNSPETGLMAAFGHWAITRGYVGSMCFSFNAMALRAMTDLFVSLSTGGLPPKLPLPNG